jgi:hypothetical protein
MNKIIDFFKDNQWVLRVGWVTALITWLQSASNLPNWLMVAGGILIALLLLVMLIFWKNSYGKNSYTADEIDGYRWIWNYDNAKGIEDLSLCCSQCGAQLLPQNYVHPRSPEGYAIENRYSCICSNSKCKKSYEFSRDIGRFKKDVEVIILAKRNNGAWKAAKKENYRKEREFKKYFC